MYSTETDFAAMAKLIRGAFHLCDFRLNKEILGEIDKMTSELERFVPLMDKEFIYCSKTILYARRQIEARRGIKYAAGLSRELTNQEREQLRSASFASNPSLGANGRQSNNDFSDELRDDDDDDS